MKKTGLENFDTLPEKDDIEKAKMASDSTLKQVTFETADDATPEKATAELADNATKVAVDSTPRKVSAKIPEMAVQ